MWKKESNLKTIINQIKRLYPNEVKAKVSPKDINRYIDLTILNTSVDVESVFLFNIPRSFRFHSLFLCSDNLSEKDYNSILRSLWVGSPYPNLQNYKTIIWLFKDANPALLLNKEEVVKLQNLPQVVTVYRGVEIKEHKKLSLSWTLDIRVAECFAKRHKKLLKTEDRKILQAAINKKYIYAYFDNGKMFKGKKFNETEVILDPKYLRNVKEIKLNTSE